MASISNRTRSIGEFSETYFLDLRKIWGEVIVKHSTDTTAAQLDQIENLFLEYMDKKPRKRLINKQTKIAISVVAAVTGVIAIVAIGIGITSPPNYQLSNPPSYPNPEDQLMMQAKMMYQAYSGTVPLLTSDQASSLTTYAKTACEDVESGNRQPFGYRINLYSGPTGLQGENLGSDVPIISARTVFAGGILFYCPDPKIEQTALDWSLNASDFKSYSLK